ncbi:hypothetical protein, partial [Rhodovulum sp.]|uniref:hypothetical protein n=1 Tax=Rhodovulum sp. TaxID=34009 RepID=UPI00257C250C
DWTMPASLGALFAGLAPGARVKVSLTLGDGHSIAPACSINGHECGMLSNVGAPDPVTGLADSAWFGIAPDRGLTISPSRNRISYVAEAGSYRPKACGPGGTPAFPGLPDGICDFSGYEAEFAITRTSASDKDATMTVVPLPAGLPLIGVALILLYTLRRAR